jgi:hypothetical protein
MAEVIATFGALSSFIQLLDFGVKVSKHAHKIISSEANAGVYDHETKKLSKEYQSLAKQADTSIEDKEAHTAESIVRVQQRLQDEAQQLVEQLEALTVTPFEAYMIGRNWNSTDRTSRNSMGFLRLFYCNRWLQSMTSRSMLLLPNSKRTPLTQNQPSRSREILLNSSFSQKHKTRV